jgi:hypothetical protein
MIFGGIWKEFCILVMNQRQRFFTERREEKCSYETNCDFVRIKNHFEDGI